MVFRYLFHLSLGLSTATFGSFILSKRRCIHLDTITSMPSLSKLGVIQPKITIDSQLDTSIPTTPPLSILDVIQLKTTSDPQNNTDIPMKIRMEAFVQHLQNKITTQLQQHDTKTFIADKWQRGMSLLYVHFVILYLLFSTYS